MCWVLHVCVRRGPQPVYYTDKYTTDAWIRRSESCFLMEPSLIRDREESFFKARQGRGLQRTWRHVAARQIPFEEHLEARRGRE